MLIRKVEKIKIKLDSKNIRKYKTTCRKFNRQYNKVLSKLLTEKYSLPTREEWDNLIVDINSLKKEIKSLKSNKKTEDEIFEESKNALKIFKGELVENKDDNINTDLILEEKENQLKLLLEHKNNIQISANNSNITSTTINNLLDSNPFDSKIGSYFQRVLVTSIDRFKAKPKDKNNTEFNEPLAGLPRYRKINQPITLEFTNQSYRFLKNNKNKIKGIKLGAVFPNIKFRSKFSYEFLNNNIKINNIAIIPVSEYSIINGKFYLLINYEYKDWKPLPNFKNKVGIDVGLSDLVVTSDGEKFNYPENSIEKIENKRIRLQSILSNKKSKNKYWKKSNRYRKLKHRVDKLYAKEKSIRENFAHQISRYLVNKYDIITMEDLNISSMIKNKNLSWKIANASWNRLAVLLEYKSKYSNKIFRKSYRLYSSTKICHKCKKKSNKFQGIQSLSIRDWICDNCGTHHNRDINAAKNIRDWEPESEKATSRTKKIVEKVRRSQIRDFTNWIVFSIYLDIIQENNEKQNLYKILKLSNINELTIIDNKYIDELLEKDKNKKNGEYDLANNKIKELKKTKTNKSTRK